MIDHIGEKKKHLAFISCVEKCFYVYRFFFIDTIYSDEFNYKLRWIPSYRCCDKCKDNLTPYTNWKNCMRKQKHR